jgi:hypothetical protein
MRVRLFALALILLPMCEAGVLYDTLVDPDVGNRGFDTHVQYQSFSTTLGLFGLNDVQVRLQGDNKGTGSVSVDLYADSASTPGGLLWHIGSVSDNKLPFSGPGVFDLPILPFTLTASTRYWIGLSSSDGSHAFWDLGLTGPGDTGTAGEFMDDSGNNGSDSFLNFQMKVTTGAPVANPEPAGMVLAGIGVAGLIFLRGLRRTSY